MKKELMIAGECMVLIVLLLVVKILLGIYMTGVAESNIVSCVFYAIAGMGGALIYRINMKKQ